MNRNKFKLMTLLRFLRTNTLRVLVTSTLFLSFPLSGCQSTASHGTEEKPVTNAANTTSSISPAPEANVFIDDVMLAKPYAMIGGTVQNIGGIRLEKLSIDIELRRRVDNSLIKRDVKVEPSDLAPGEKGKFSLKVFSDEWSGSRILSLRSRARTEEIAFKSLPGAKRPPEKPPAGNVIEVKTRKQTKSNGEEFLNTPDTPVKVP